MIDFLPFWINSLFIITVILTIGLFYYSNGKPKILILITIAWSTLQSYLAYIGFYQITDSIPPRFVLVLLPTTLLIIYGLLPNQKDWLFNNRNTQISSLLHIVRLPVEIVLYGLFTHNMIPELMTFEGRNFDIIIGITSPVIALYYFRNKLNKQSLLIWNFIGLCFVLFILFNGILSSELPFQQFGFEQPNRAINYFPFVLLPATVVPIVIWSHLSDIIKLKNEIKHFR